MYFAKNGLSHYSFNGQSIQFTKFFRNLESDSYPLTKGKSSDRPYWLPAGLLMMMLAGLLLGAMVWPAQAKAETIFVKDPITEAGITGDEAQATKALIRSAVANRPGDQLVANESMSKIQLQPRLLRLGDIFLLTLEKAINGEIVYVSQTKFPRITELDMAAKRTVSNVLAEPLASYKKGGAARYPSAPFSNASAENAGDKSGSTTGDSSAPRARANLGTRANSGQSYRADSGSNSGAKSAQIYGAKTAQNMDRPAEDTSSANSLKSSGGYDSNSGDRSGNRNGNLNAASTGTSVNASGTDSTHSSTNGSANDAVAGGGAYDDSSNSQNAPQMATGNQNSSGQPNGANGDSPIQNRGAKTADPADVTRSSRQLQNIVNEFPERQTNRWLVGLGPMVSRHMASDQVMYGLAGAFVWDMNPFLSTKIMVEANLTGGGDGAQFYNGSIGGNYYFVNRIENAPYVTADVGYGYASSISDGMAEGFSLGLGAGYELLRTSTNPLDLSFRFSTIFSGMSKGYGDPSIIGARVSVSI